MTTISKDVITNIIKPFAIPNKELYIKELYIKKQIAYFKNYMYNVFNYLTIQNLERGDNSLFVPLSQRFTDDITDIPYYFTVRISITIKDDYAHLEVISTRLNFNLKFEIYEEPTALYKVMSSMLILHNCLNEKYKFNVINYNKKSL